MVCFGRYASKIRSVVSKPVSQFKAIGLACFVLISFSTVDMAYAISMPVAHFDRERLHSESLPDKKSTAAPVIKAGMRFGVRRSAKRGISKARRSRGKSFRRAFRNVRTKGVRLGNRFGTRRHFGQRSRYRSGTGRLGAGNRIRGHFGGHKFRYSGFITGRGRGFVTGGRFASGRYLTGSRLYRNKLRAGARRGFRGRHVAGRISHNHFLHRRQKLVVVNKSVTRIIHQPVVRKENLPVISRYSFRSKACHRAYYLRSNRGGTKNLKCAIVRGNLSKYHRTARR